MFLRLKKIGFVRILVCLTLQCVINAQAQESGTIGAPSAELMQSEELSVATASAPESWAIHGQLTNITQKHNVFDSPYQGKNSLNPNGDAEETTDITFFGGVRLWPGAEFWLNTEVDQGFGFDNTLGVAGYPSGGAYKIGANTPYLRLPRLFFRQVINLDTSEQIIAAAANQLGGIQSDNNVTVTAGKLAVTDIFDTNSYAHDPRADFLNWALIDAGSFDYAADSWGYTYGAALEWNQGAWTLRGGFFQLSPVPNGKISHIEFSENSTVVEAEERHVLFGHPGKLKVLGWINHGNMGSYQDALKLGAQTGTTPDVALVRKIGSRSGIALNLEQELTPFIGAFARLSSSRGDKETYEFTDINTSLAGGVAMKGEGWNRPGDSVGMGAVVNRISADAQHYFSDGGLGVLIGDGRLTYSPEKIIELYYSFALNNYSSLALDYQHITNPAYNQDRGPVSIYGLRVHGSF